MMDYRILWHGRQLALIRAESPEKAIEKLLSERGYGYLRGGVLTAEEIL